MGQIKKDDRWMRSAPPIDVCNGYDQESRLFSVFISCCNWFKWQNQIEQGFLNHFGDDYQTFKHFQSTVEF